MEIGHKNVEKKLNIFRYHVQGSTQKSADSIFHQIYLSLKIMKPC